MQVISLVSFSWGNLKSSHIRAYRIPIFVTEIFFRWFTHHTGLILLKRIGPVRIDRHTIPLHLPVTRNNNIIPICDTEVIFIEIYRTDIRLGRPIKFPDTIQRNNFLAFTFPRRQCQRCMIFLLIDSDNSRIFPVRHILPTCRYSNEQKQ